MSDAAREGFVDRRNYANDPAAPVRERRQFANSHDELGPDAQELAAAVDAYKLRHRRRFITYDELLGVLAALGYHKTANEPVEAR